MNFFKGWYALSILMAIFTVLFSFHTPLFSQASSLQIPRLYIEVDDGMVLTFKNVRRIAIGNPAILDATLGSSNEVILRGLSVGYTNLYLWGRKGRKIYKVYVVSPKVLQGVLSVPGVQISVYPSGLTVRGAVTTEKVKQDMLGLLRSRYPEVKDEVEVSPGRSVSDIIPPELDKGGVKFITKVLPLRYRSVSDLYFVSTFWNYITGAQITPSQSSSIGIDVTWSPSGGMIKADVATNSLIIMDRPEVISTIEKLLRILDVPLDSKLAKRLGGNSSAALSDTPPVLEHLVSRIFFPKSRNADSLKSPLAVFASADAKMISDSTTNTLLVIDYPSNLATMEEYLSYLDIQGRAQVLIEARFVQIRDDAFDDLGVALGGLTAQNTQGNGISVANTPTFGTTGTESPFSTVNLNGGSLILRNLNLKTLDITLSALANQGKLKKLSSPKVVTLSGQSATVQSTRDQPYISDVSATPASTGSTQLTFSFSTSVFSAGVTMTVTPQVLKDDIILIELAPSVTASGGNVNLTIPGSTQSITQPIQVIQSLTSTVKIKNGSTIVIGGFHLNDKQVNASKTPFLGDIPILGRLFRRDNKIESDEQILIFLQASLINPDGTKRPFFDSYRQADEVRKRNNSYLKSGGQDGKDLYGNPVSATP